MSCCPFILEIRESSGSTGSTRGGGVGTRLPASSLSPGRFQLQDTFRKFQVNEAWALIHSGCPWPVQNIGIPLGIACDNPKNIGRFPAVEPHMDSGGVIPDLRDTAGTSRSACCPIAAWHLTYRDFATGAVIQIPISGVR